jgi:hypothetical protein
MENNTRRSSQHHHQAEQTGQGRGGDEFPSPTRWQRPVTVLGATGCALLALILPTNSALAGAAVLTVGLVGRTLSNHRGRRR